MTVQEALTVSRAYFCTRIVLRVLFRCEDKEMAKLIAFIGLKNFLH